MRECRLGLLLCGGPPALRAQSPPGDLGLVDGDAHVGAFLALLGQGFDPLTAARGANAAAAFSVTRRGPATAPGRTELAAFLAGDPPAGQLA
ncbi:hypothetical protein [Streptomyces sp. NPDC001714]|uniref:hypothetical protein n=1 Tax=Streptomyces sp. NPDC001714 TaxID=3364603 RepID=UPI00368AA91A